MKIPTRQFGILPSGESASLYELYNSNGISVTVSDYGCTIVSLLTPDRSGDFADIVTGYRTWQEWMENPAYFGCIIGRTCNRIANGSFKLDGREYHLPKNLGEHNLHGGIHGFSRKLWKAEEIGLNSLRFSYLSPDGEEGYPGNVNVTVIYQLTEHDELIMKFSAITDKVTPVNMTNHCYFNLRGDGSGLVYDQELMIRSEMITETDSSSIPTGKLINTRNSPFDFSVSCPIGAMIDQLVHGYDDNFVLQETKDGSTPQIIANDPVSGRKLSIYTTEPGVQLYTANWFDGSIIGKSGIPYEKQSSFAHETQHFPDSVNHDEFPSIILHPGQLYESMTRWRFEVLQQ